MPTDRFNPSDLESAEGPRCPTCGKPVDPTAAQQRGSAYPFCSPRCKLVDLGRWLDGAYQVPSEDDDLDEADLDVLPPPDEPRRR